MSSAPSSSALLAASLELSLAFEIHFKVKFFDVALEECDDIFEADLKGVLSLAMGLSDADVSLDVSREEVNSVGALLPPLFHVPLSHPFFSLSIPSFTISAWLAMHPLRS
jgi:hypothetical protein